jgi:hypothetical protein
MKPGSPDALKAGCTYETDPAPAESDAAPEDFQKAFDRVTQKIGPSCARLAESDAEWHAQAAAAAAEYDDMEREAEANGGADAMTRALIAAGRKSLAMGPPSPEITPAMIEAGKGIEIDGLPGCLDHDELSAIYRAMRALEAK